MRRDNIEVLKREIKKEIVYKMPTCNKSFAYGFEAGLKLFSPWRDGNRVFGTAEHTTRELHLAVTEIIDEFDKEGGVK